MNYFAKQPSFLGGEHVRLYVWSTLRRHEEREHGQEAKRVWGCFQPIRLGHNFIQSFLFLHVKKATPFYKW